MVRLKTIEIVLKTLLLRFSSDSDLNNVVSEAVEMPTQRRA